MYQMSSENIAEHTDKPKMSSTKYLLRRIEFLPNLDKNNLFEEMKKSLEDYNTEVKNQIYDNIEIQYSSFKANFYKNLENLLYQISFIKDKKIKLSRTKKTYDWYRIKTFRFKKICDIRAKTHKLNYQKEQDPNAFQNSNKFLADHFPNTFEFENRSVIEAGMPPRDKLKEFLTHGIIKDSKEQVKKRKTERELEAKKSKEDLVFIKVKDNDIDSSPSPKKNNNKVSNSLANFNTISTTSFSNFNLDTEESIKKERDTSLEDRFRNTVQTVNSVSGFRSTQYTADINGNTGINFFSNIKHPTFQSSKGELKSNYISFKPKNTYDNHKLEKLFAKKKYDEMREKRHKFEEEEFIRNFKIKYAENLEYKEHKLDAKKVLEKYENDIRNKTGDLATMNDDSISAARKKIVTSTGKESAKEMAKELAKERYKDFSDKKQINNRDARSISQHSRREEEKSTTRLRNNTTDNVESPKKSTRVNKKNIKNLKIILAKKRNKQNKGTKEQNKKEVNDDDSEKPKEIHTTTEGKGSAVNVLNYITNSTNNINTVTTPNTGNTPKKSPKIKEKIETFESIITSENINKKSLTYEDNVNQSDKLDKGYLIPPDITSKGIFENKLFRSRKLYEVAINTEFKPNKKFIKENTKLSKYDPSNVQFVEYNNFLDYNSIRPLTTAGSMLEKPMDTDKNNLLDMRRNMAKYKPTKDIMRIKTSLSKSKINIPLTKLRQAFQCPETDYIYNAAFLPGNSCYGLIARPEPAKAKK